MTYTRHRPAAVKTTGTRNLTRTRRQVADAPVRRTRWYPVSGEVQHFFDDVLVKASRTLPSHLVDHMPPWRWTAWSPFCDEYLSGHVTGCLFRQLERGFREAC